MMCRRVHAACTVLVPTTMPPAARPGDAGDDAANATATPGWIRLLPLIT